MGMDLNANFSEEQFASKKVDIVFEDKKQSLLGMFMHNLIHAAEARKLSIKSHR